MKKLIELLKERWEMTLFGGIAFTATITCGMWEWQQPILQKWVIGIILFCLGSVAGFFSEGKVK